MHNSVQLYEKSTKLGPIILLLWTSVDTIIFGTNGARIFLYIPRIMSLLFCVYTVIRVRKGKIRVSRSLIVLLCMVTITIASGLYNRTEVATIISRILPLFVGYCLSETYTIDDFIKAFDKFLYTIAIFSLCLYILTALAPSIVQRFPSFLNENNIRVYTIFFGSVFEGSINGVFSRMSAIFWEPGAYAIYLCIGIFFQLFFNEKTNYKKTIIYMICVIITFSTTGIIGLIIIGLAFLQKRNVGNSIFMKGLIVLAILLLFAIAVFSTESAFIDKFFSKITNRTGTTITRYSSFINGFQIALDHPWLGVGAQAGSYITQYAILSGYGRNRMLTNTYMAQFANYGIIFGSLFLIGTFAFFWKQTYRMSKLTSALLFLSLIALYTGENFFSFLPFVFVFFGVQQDSDNKAYYC